MAASHYVILLVVWRFVPLYPLAFLLLCTLVIWLWLTVRKLTRQKI